MLSVANHKFKIGSRNIEDLDIIVLSDNSEESTMCDAHITSNVIQGKLPMANSVKRKTNKRAQTVAMIDNIVQGTLDSTNIIVVLSHEVHFVKLYNQATI